MTTFLISLSIWAFLVVMLLVFIHGAVGSKGRRG